MGDAASTAPYKLASTKSMFLLAFVIMGLCHINTDTVNKLQACLASQVNAIIHVKARPFWRGWRGARNVPYYSWIHLVSLGPGSMKENLCPYWKADIVVHFKLYTKLV